MPSAGVPQRRRSGRRYPRGRFPEFPIGLVPNPGQELPALSGPLYYRRHESGTFVRADITYLRQDFSVRMAVKDHGPWPEMQRFDFLVRTNVLTAEQANALPAKTIDQTEVGAALRFAVAELTNRRRRLEVE